MRVRTDELFRASEALRRRVEELEAINRDMVKALRLANDQTVNLARRVQYVENRLMQLTQEGQDHG
jgi:phosphopantothenate synthetase